MFCLILSVFHFKTNYYLCVAVTLVAAVLYWAAESCWCLHVVFRVRRINWTKYKLMKNDSYAETNCTFTHHKGAPALVVCVCVCLQSNCVELCCTARWHKAFLCQSAGGPTVCVACCSLVHAYMRTCVSHWCRSLETLSASGLGGWTEAPRHSAAVKWAIVLLMLRRAVTQTWGGNGLLKYMQSTTRCLWSPGNSTGPTVHAGILLNIQAFSLRCSRRSEHSLCMFQITYNKCRVIVGAISIGGILFSYVLMFINVSSSCHVGRVWPTNYNPEIFKLKA